MKKTYRCIHRVTECRGTLWLVPEREVLKHGYTTESPVFEKN